MNAGGTDFAILPSDRFIQRNKIISIFAYTYSEHFSFLMVDFQSRSRLRKYQVNKGFWKRRAQIRLESLYHRHIVRVCTQRWQN